MKLRKSLVLVTIVACSPALRASEDMEDCAAIQSAVARLDCYDRIARRPSAAPPPAPEDRPAGSLPTDPAFPVTERPNQDQERFGISLFGKRAGDPDRGESIQSRIESVHENNTGRRVITLANGQVWMEREAGQRRIDGGQNVVITKHRLHYSMLLETQNRKVTVQRID